MNFLIVFAAKYLIAIVALLFLLTFFLIPKSKRKGFILLTITTALIALVGDKILGLIYNNPRPFSVEKITPLVSHVADNGFPSGHTLIAIMAAAIAYLYKPKLGIVLFILALIVGGARVLAKVHHSIDILASIVLAIVATYAASIIIKKFFPENRV